jgi:hypothetical protein
VSFVDETSNVAAEYGHEQISYSTQDDFSPPSENEHPSRSAITVHDLLLLPYSTNSTVNLESFPENPNLIGLSIDDAATNFLPLIASPISTSAAQTAAVLVSVPFKGDNQSGDIHQLLHRDDTLRLYGDRMLLPFKVPQEALLFQHFFENLAALVRYSLVETP